MAVNFHSPEGLFDASGTLFHLYNAYSIADGHPRSVSHLELFPQHYFAMPVLVTSIFIISPQILPFTSPTINNS